MINKKVKRNFRVCIYRHLLFCFFFTFNPIVTVIIRTSDKQPKPLKQGNKMEKVFSQLQDDEYNEEAAIFYF